MFLDDENQIKSGFEIFIVSRFKYGLDWLMDLKKGILNKFTKIQKFILFDYLIIIIINAIFYKFLLVLNLIGVHCIVRHGRRLAFIINLTDKNIQSMNFNLKKCYGIIIR